MKYRPLSALLLLLVCLPACSKDKSKTPEDSPSSDDSAESKDDKSEEPKGTADDTEPKPDDNDNQGPKGDPDPAPKPTVDDEPKQEPPAGSGGAPATAACDDCAAPNFCVAGKCEAPGSAVTSIAMGRDPGQVGIRQAVEGEGEAPMSFALRSDGKVLVLDQMNSRLQLFNGDLVERVFPLDSAYYQDIVLLSDQTAVLMDKHSAKELVVMKLEDNGSVVRRVPLAGIGVDDPEEAGRMYVTRAGVFVVYQQGIHYLNANGTEATRSRVSGLVTCDGEKLLSAEIQKRLLTVTRGNRSGPLQPETFSHEFPASIHTFWMDTDCNGNTYVVTGNFDLPQNQGRSQLTVFDKDFKVIREDKNLAFPETSIDADTFKEELVTSSGDFYRYVFNKSGIAFLRY